VTAVDVWASGGIAAVALGLLLGLVQIDKAEFDRPLRVATVCVAFAMPVGLYAAIWFAVGLHERTGNLSTGLYEAAAISAMLAGLADAAAIALVLSHYVLAAGVVFGVLAVAAAVHLRLAGKGSSPAPKTTLGRADTPWTPRRLSRARRG
jgi:hypothetical protein